MKMIELVTRYSNAHMVVERAETLFTNVNRLRGDLSALVDVLDSENIGGVAMLASFAELDAAMRNMEKLIQTAEKDARERAYETRVALLKESE